jgi:GxxExxY protein
MLIHEDVTNKIISAAIEVHKELGPGMLELAYKEALAYELKFRGLNIKLEVPIPIKYKNIKLECGYRADIIVEELVVVELKAQKDNNDIFAAQLLTNTKLSGYKIGLLLNFHHKKLIDGIRRFVF